VSLAAVIAIFQPLRRFVAALSKVRSFSKRWTRSVRFDHVARLIVNANHGIM
jgi:hypothetical protein